MLIYLQSALKSINYNGMRNFIGEKNIYNRLPSKINHLFHFARWPENNKTATFLNYTARIFKLCKYQRTNIYTFSRNFFFYLFLHFILFFFYFTNLKQWNRPTNSQYIKNNNKTNNKWRKIIQKKKSKKYIHGKTKTRHKIIHLIESSLFHTRHESWVPWIHLNAFKLEFYLYYFTE